MLCAEWDWKLALEVSREEALEEGREEGIQRGIQKGREEGRQEQALATARKLKAMNMPLVVSNTKKFTRLKDTIVLA